jgi:hypothetical protein
MTYVLRIWSDPASIGRLAIRLTLLAIRRIARAPSLAAFAASMDRGAKIAGASNGAHGVRPDQILEQPASDDVRFCAYSVEKVLFGRRTKFFRTADAFHARRREGPHRFTQTQPRPFPNDDLMIVARGADKEDVTLR